MYLLTGLETSGQAARWEQKLQTWEAIQIRHQPLSTTHHGHQPTRGKSSRSQRGKREHMTNKVCLDIRFLLQQTTLCVSKYRSAEIIYDRYIDRYIYKESTFGGIDKSCVEVLNCSQNA